MVAEPRLHDGGAPFARAALGPREPTAITLSRVCGIAAGLPALSWVYRGHGVRRRVPHAPRVRVEERPTTRGAGCRGRRHRPGRLPGRPPPAGRLRESLEDDDVAVRDR